MGTTEKDALAMWCPFTRVTTFVNRNGDAKALGNRESFAPCGAPDGIASDRCIGSACMAWRWLRKPGKPGEFDQDEPGSGYCGLAGTGSI